MIVKNKNVPTTFFPCVRLKASKPETRLTIPKSKKTLRALQNDEERRDAKTTQQIRQMLREINKKKDGQYAFFLLAGFFSNNPVETLGPRTTKEIALSLSRGEVPVDNFRFLLDALETSLVYLKKAEVLCEKLRHVGFPQDKKGLKRVRSLHFVLTFWEKSLRKEKRIHKLVA